MAKNGSRHSMHVQTNGNSEERIKSTSEDQNKLIFKTEWNGKERIKIYSYVQTDGFDEEQGSRHSMHVQTNLTK